VTTRKKWTLAIAALAVVLAVVVYLFTPSGAVEPSYAGHTLSEWLRFDRGPFPAPDKPVPPPTPAEAVRHIGTNAIPFLLRLIAECDSRPAKERVLAWLSNRLPKRLRPAQSSGYGERLAQAEAATSGMRILGPAAAPAIPELEKIANGSGGDSVSFAIDALAGIGHPARQALERLAQSTNAKARILATTINGINGLRPPPSSTN
jgi:hypothetical protein